MIENLTKTKYSISITSNFKKNYKKIIKQGKSKVKIREIIEKLANGEELEPKYRNHKLIDIKYYRDFNECHIEPDWLLIYKYVDDELILLLSNTRSHSELFK